MPPYRLLSYRPETVAIVMDRWNLNSKLRNCIQQHGSFAKSKTVRGFHVWLNNKEEVMLEFMAH